MSSPETNLWVVNRNKYIFDTRHQKLIQQKSKKHVKMVRRQIWTSPESNLISSYVGEW